MVYALIFLGLAVVIAPLVSVMPSKAQRRKAALRDRARELGLRVSLRPLPEVPPRFRFVPEGELVSYERLLPKSLQQSARCVRYVRCDGEWLRTSGETEAPDWLASLPDGVALVQLSEAAISIFWNEQGAIEDLECISQAIEIIS